jgi:hypothetical protein
MVKFRLPRGRIGVRKSPPQSKARAGVAFGFRRKRPQRRPPPNIVKILIECRCFKFEENLRLIHVDFAQKLRAGTNDGFNRLC